MVDEKKDNKSNASSKRLQDAFKMLEDFRSQLSHKKLVGAKTFLIGLLIADIIIFGYLFKNRFFLMLIFIVALIFIIVVFALDSYYFPKEFQEDYKQTEKENTKDEQDEKRDNSDKKRPKKPKDDEGDSETQQYEFFGSKSYENLDFGLSDPEEMNRRARAVILPP